jgi:hypothetical protein
MDDLKARLAALPPMSNPAWDGDYETAYLALAARNALLCAALRNASHELNIIHARDGVPYDHNGWKSSVTQEYFTQVVEDSYAILAACEQEQRK